jgi:cold shock CspA family protein
MRERGVIRKYLPERGYGFIQADGGGSLFFHCSQLRPEVPQSEIQEGVRVAFETSCKYERPRAEDIELL